MYLLSDPAIPLLSMYPREIKHRFTHKDTHTHIHTHKPLHMNVYSSLFFFMIVKIWRQSRSLLTREWKNCSIFMEYLWYITEYDPRITRTKYNWNYVMDEPPKILLKESSLKKKSSLREKSLHCMIQSTWSSTTGKSNLQWEKIRLDAPLQRWKKDWLVRGTRKFSRMMATL